MAASRPANGSGCELSLAVWFFDVARRYVESRAARARIEECFDCEATCTSCADACGATGRDRLRRPARPGSPVKSIESAPQGAFLVLLISSLIARLSGRLSTGPDSAWLSYERRDRTSDLLLVRQALSQLSQPPSAPRVPDSR